MNLICCYKTTTKNIFIYANKSYLIKLLMLISLITFIPGYIKYNTPSDMIGSDIYPEYNDLKTVNGTLKRYKGSGRSSKHILIDSNTGSEYIATDIYPITDYIVMKISVFLLN